jgi:hypothetical protein
MMINEDRPTRNNQSRRACRLLLTLAAIFAQASLLAENVPAIQEESHAEKEANLKQQTLGGLFHRWTFDEQKSDEVPVDFSQLSVGGEPLPTWTIDTDAEAPSPPNILKAVSPCQVESCYRMLVANKLQYEYPDVSVRLRFPGGGGVGQGGIVIGLRDAKQFYAAIVNLAAKKLEVIRVVDGQATVLGETAINPKAVDWHSLRIQHNTIISKDFIETFFDGALVLSVQDHSLGIGQIGLLVSGNSSLHFDSLHAVPLFSQRPFSAPAAY